MSSVCGSNIESTPSRGTETLARGYFPTGIYPVSQDSRNLNYCKMLICGIRNVALMKPAPQGFPS